MRLKKIISCMLICVMFISVYIPRVEVCAKTLSESVDLTVVFGEYDTMVLKKDEITTLKIVMKNRGIFELDFSPNAITLYGQLYDENNNELAYTTGGIGRGPCYADQLNSSEFRTVKDQWTCLGDLEPGVYYLKLWRTSSKSIKKTFFAKQIPSDDVSFEINIVLKKGESIQLGTITENTKDDTVKWSSKNKKIASVNTEGKIKAIKKGTTVIKAYTESGLVTKIKVKVK